MTLFPASQPAKHGWAQVGQAFQRVASLYSNSTPVTFELLAAGVSGDLAYVVGYERGAASVGGGPEGRISTLNPYQGLLTRAASAAVGST